MTYQTLTQTDFPDYQLLDSGNGRKLERFGNYVLSRPDYHALWQPSLNENEWEKADAILNTDRNWELKKEIPDNWLMHRKNLSFSAKLTPFGHTGVFPEQSNHWDFISNHKDLNVLSLFSYTGISTLAAALNNKVCHVDASKPAVSWARENQALSKLEKRPIRWIIDDGLKFVKREAKRGAKYDAIIMDPPKFGRGPKGEVWKFEDSFMDLLYASKLILSDDPRYFIITAYAIALSPLTLGTTLEELMKDYKGSVEYGELGLSQTGTNRFLPQAIFARWSKN